VRRKSSADGRAVELVLSPKLLRTYAKYEDLIRSLQLQGGDPAVEPV